MSFFVLTYSDFHDVHQDVDVPGANRYRGPKFDTHATAVDALRRYTTAGAIDAKLTELSYDQCREIMFGHRTLLKTVTKPKINDQRFVLETTDYLAAKVTAESNGWDGNPDTMLNYCNAFEDAARYTEHETLGIAIDEARADQPPFGPLFESATIEHQVYVQAYDQGGLPVEDIGYWEVIETWEVYGDGTVTRGEPAERSARTSE
jgi:hypothetical protein